MVQTDLVTANRVTERRGRRDRRRRWLLLYGPMLVLLLLAVPAFACSPNANITLEKSSSDAGVTNQIQGTLFDPAGQPVKVWLDGASGQLLATVQPDAEGSWSTTVTIPADTAPGPHSIAATQRASDGNFYSAPAAFEVTGETEPAEQPPAEEPAPDNPPAEEPAEQPAPAPAASDPANEPAPEPQPAQEPAEQPVQEPVQPAAQEPAAPAAVQPEQPAAQPAAQAPAPVSASIPSREPVAAQPVAKPAPAAAALAAPPVEPEVSNGNVAGSPERVVSVPAGVENQVPMTGSANLQALDQTPQISSFGDSRTVDPSGVPWALIPALVLGAGLFAFGAAAFVNEERRNRTRAHSE